MSDTASTPTNASDASTPSSDAPDQLSQANQAALLAADPELQDSLILIVDDNAQNVELLEAYLEPLGVETETANDGIEAIARMEDPEKPLPDLILLDVMMPRMSGFEVCRKLKDEPRTRPVPIMMVTALNEMGDIERGVESGTDDFVTKPVNRLELITRVKSLLRVRKLKLELDRTEEYIRSMAGESQTNAN